MKLKWTTLALSRWADVILIAPATANTISKLAQGTTDDLASTVVLASDKNIYLAPAMNVRMWEHQSTKQNLNKLKTLIIKLLVQKLEIWLVVNMVRVKCQIHQQ